MASQTTEVQSGQNQWQVRFQTVQVSIRLFYMRDIRNKTFLWYLQNSIFNTLRPKQNRRHFADDILKCIFFNENAWISLKISLKFVPMVRINNIPALVQIMAWRRSGDKPLSEPMMVSLLTHICVTRPQWVKQATGCRPICFCTIAVLAMLSSWEARRSRSDELTLAVSAMLSCWEARHSRSDELTLAVTAMLSRWEPDIAGQMNSP